MLSEIELNFIAGIVDGEGTISISKRTYRDTDYSTSVVISNTNLDLLKYVRNITKLGNLRVSRNSRENYKKQYELMLRRYEYKKFLIPILSYLVIKTRQAELVLQYISLRKASRGHSLTDEEIEIRENIYREIKSLNRKGQTYLEEVEKFPKLQGNLKELTKGNYAYLAALVDGEGCFNIIKQKYINYSYELQVYISNTNIKLIHYIQMLTYVGYVTCKIRSSNLKNMYVWNLYVYQMKDFLIKTKPYLKIKNKQCDLLLEYFQVKGDRRINELTKQEKITLELIYDEVKEINKRRL
jgi:hypothetical protein